MSTTEPGIPDAAIEAYHRAFNDGMGLGTQERIRAGLRAAAEHLKPAPHDPPRVDSPLGPGRSWKPTQENLREVEREAVRMLPDLAPETDEAPELLRQIFTDPDVKLREDVAASIYADGESEWLSTVDGSPNAATFEYARRVLSSGRVVPATELTRTADLAGFRLRGWDRTRAERDALVDALGRQGEAMAVLQARLERTQTERDEALEQLEVAEDPTTIPARLLSGEHVGREVVLPDGARGFVSWVELDVRLHVPGEMTARRLAPDDVVTLLAETGVDQ